MPDIFLTESDRKQFKGLGKAWCVAFLRDNRPGSTVYRKVEAFFLELEREEKAEREAADSKHLEIIAKDAQTPEWRTTGVWIGVISLALTAIAMVKCAPDHPSAQSPPDASKAIESTPSQRLPEGTSTPPAESGLPPAVKPSNGTESPD